MLDKIISTKKSEVEKLVLPPTQDVSRKSLFQALFNCNREIGLIAEVKKASPSKGIIRDNFHPVEIALAYENAGADAISVLTDEHFFQGHSDYLTAVKKNVNIPVLRKDFIINKKQIEESVRIGADAILLIGEALEPTELYEFYNHAYAQGLECLVEVHSYETLVKVLNVFTPQILGINNRNLLTFETAITNTRDLASYVPSGCLLISESGIHTNKDINEVRNFGASGVLVGEAFMRANEPGEGIRRLFGEV